VGKGTISGSIAKQVLETMIARGDGAAAIVEREGLKQESDSGAIEAAVDKVLADNADKVEQFKAGKEALFGFFVGQTMKAMQGKANPQLVNEVLLAKLAQGTKPRARRCRRLPPKPRRRRCAGPRLHGTGATRKR